MYCPRPPRPFLPRPAPPRTKDYCNTPVFSVSRILYYTLCAAIITEVLNDNFSYFAFKLLYGIVLPKIFKPNSENIFNVGQLIF